MAANGHRRQVLLFLVAIILPCAVLVVLVLRMVAQERELDQQHLADERRTLTGQLRQELAARLDRIALTEASALLAHPQHPASRAYQHPGVVLVATVADGSLVLPWEHDPRPAQFQRSLGEPDFAQRIARGERAEIGSRRPAEAADAYTDAMVAARDRAQAAYARLLRGRALLAAGRRGEALRDYAAILESDADLLDEHGVPLALYAASRLLGAGWHSDTVIAALRGILNGASWLSPTALYLLRELDASLKQPAGNASTNAAQRGLRDAIAARLALAEQAVALQRDYPRLGLGAGGMPGRGPEPHWVAYTAPLSATAWLVGRVTPLGRDSETVVAVLADSMFAAVEHAIAESGGVTADLVVASADGAFGEELGAAFPALRVRFGPPASPTDALRDPRRWFYAVTLLLVISVTLFGAYLASRDVRRELRLAELRSRFVSAVSHELKTPLTAIRMYAETLQLGRSPDPATQAEYLETIVNESERLTRLLNNVLEFSMIERGRKRYGRMPNDLADIIAASVRAMHYPLEQQQFTLDLELQPDVPAVKVDRDAIQQAIMNLLANALKYSGDSRVIGLRLTHVDGEATIEVTDRGVGIAPDELTRIFEQFYRVSTPENDGIPGTGLGLTLVRHIAEGHGGRVTVASAPGEGSTFTIHIPLGNGGA